MKKLLILFFISNIYAQEPLSTSVSVDEDGDEITVLDQTVRNKINVVNEVQASDLYGKRPEEVLPPQVEPKLEVASIPVIDPLNVDPDLSVSVHDSSLSTEKAAKLGTYQVVSGDQLLKISYKLFGTTKRWKELLELNSDLLTEKSILKIGMRLKFSLPDNGTYSVVRGDQLLKISQSLYGTTKRWKELKILNKELLKKSNVLKIGMKLKFILPTTKSTPLNE
jgi:nucleoid-associated protein YgaU